jgi:hypothetical protein
MLLIWFGSLRVLVCCVLQHLDLELSEGFELWLEAGDELSELRNLRSLTLSGAGHTPRDTPSLTTVYVPAQTTTHAGSCQHASSGSTWAICLSVCGQQCMTLMSTALGLRCCCLNNPMLRLVRRDSRFVPASTQTHLVWLLSLTVSWR